jgi:hypothetical protein
MPDVKTETFNRDALADWYANRHFETDNGVAEIHYLPENAPAREIRFLEINTLITEMTELEPIDFGVDIGSDNSHTLYVLDTTPAQWSAIQAGHLKLPDGWSLENSQVFTRVAVPAL